MEVTYSLFPHILVVAEVLPRNFLRTSTQLFYIIITMEFQSF